MEQIRRLLFYTLFLLAFIPAACGAGESDATNDSPPSSSRPAQAEDQIKQLKITPVIRSGEAGMVQKQAHETHKLAINGKDGQEHIFNVEVAADMSSQAYGLMYRTEMEADHGMLFVFDDVSERSFWMRNTFIPLDMLFIEENGTVHHIHENAVPLDETAVDSNGPVKAVLEINGGTVAKLGIKEGNIVHFSTFGNALAQ